MRAYTELLADDPPLEGRDSRDPERRAQRSAWHDAALAQVERLDRLVDSILQSVRVVPDVPAVVVPTDVEEAVREVAESIEPLVRQHNLDIQPGVRLHALADPPRLRQILEHLIENAVKYAPPETTISIDRQLVEGWVRIGITDQGPGVPEEWRERIFEPYARRDTHTARGSGIGLYAAKRLGESMGARTLVRAGRSDRCPLCRLPPCSSGGVTSNDDRTHPAPSHPRRRRRPGHGRGDHRARRHRGPPGHHRLRRSDRGQAIPRGVAGHRPAGPGDAGTGRVHGRRPDPRRGPGADPRRLRRERRGREGQGTRHRRRRLPREAVRQGRAAGTDRRRHATCRPGVGSRHAPGR